MKNMKSCRKILLAACAAVLLPFVARAAETQLVTATGYGMSVDEAKKAAVRAAVESVVGTLVDAETIVENDQLVQDKILSYSMGMVEDVKLIGVPQKNSAGLVKVRAQVKVRKTELAERVKSTIKTSVKIDGESLYQQVAFNRQNLNDADSIMESLFKPERMKGLLKFEPDMDNGNPISVDVMTGEVFVSVKGYVDMEAYKQWADEIIAKLGPMATNKATITRKLELVERTRDDNWAGICWDAIYLGMGDFVLLRSFRSGEIVSFAFDSHKTTLLNKHLKHIEGDCTKMVDICLLDKTGDKIGGGEFSLINVFVHSYNTTIIPTFGTVRYLRELCEARAQVSIGHLSAEDLRAIDSISVEVKWEMKN